MMHFTILPFGFLGWIIPIVVIVVVVNLIRRNTRYGSRTGYDERSPYSGSYTEDRSTRDRSIHGNLSENMIFRLAKENGGQITLSEIVIETGASLKEADQFMKSITDGIHITMEVTERGTVIYDFPELKNGR